ncbi:hypothetical protein G6F46_015829 [Rhizopus delemar]|nr:hypothetical protein G6F40_017892 [Rhizopus arrhizus]KAG1577633.1 hypothetical protein G6F46_015829 [Rhizopus delemar]
MVNEALVEIDAATYPLVLTDQLKPFASPTTNIEDGAITGTCATLLHPGVVGLDLAKKALTASAERVFERSIYLI